MTSTSTVGMVGIKVVVEPKKPRLDVCLIHGLTGHRDGTWTHANKTFLPLLLKDAYPKARIMTYGYDARVFNMLKSTNVTGIRDVGKRLANDIADFRRSAPRRPIIFLVHSLGGLVVEQALLICRDERRGNRLNQMMRHTIGIFFFGTPHGGSPLAAWGYFTARIMRSLWSTDERKLAILVRDSEAREGLIEVFEEQLDRDFKHIETVCFFEALKTRGIGFIVQKKSATLGHHNNFSLDATHTQMTKFGGADDPNFVFVRGRIDDCIENASKLPRSVYRILQKAHLLHCV